MPRKKNTKLKETTIALIELKSIVPTIKSPKLKQELEELKIKLNNEIISKVIDNFEGVGK